jgi:hypothetical protein
MPPEPSSVIFFRCPADPDPGSIHEEEQEQGESEDDIDLEHAECF